MLFVHQSMICDFILQEYENAVINDQVLILGFSLCLTVACDQQGRKHPQIKGGFQRAGAVY